MRVLEGLEGVTRVKMDLERDAFQVTYVPGRVSMAAILAGIRGLGFRPEPVFVPPAPIGPVGNAGGEFPDGIETALREARKENRMLLIDFHAAWCHPCIVLEKKVLTDSRVAEALERFHLLKIDTDRDPDAARHFQVLVIPTLLVLDENGKDRFRHQGFIDATELAEILSDLRNEKKMKPRTGVRAVWPFERRRTCPG